MDTKHRYYQRSIRSDLGKQIFICCHFKIFKKIFPVRKYFLCHSIILELVLKKKKAHTHKTKLPFHPSEVKVKIDQVILSLNTTPNFRDLKQIFISSSCYMFSTSQMGAPVFVVLTQGATEWSPAAVLTDHKQTVGKDAAQWAWHWSIQKWPCRNGPCFFCSPLIDQSKFHCHL